MLKSRASNIPLDRTDRKQEVRLRHLGNGAHRRTEINHCSFRKKKKLWILHSENEDGMTV